MQQTAFTFSLYLLIVSSLIAGDRSHAPSTTRPSGVPGEIYPEKQTEGHTCGLHSMRSIYKSYHLPVENFNLRNRIGVDKSAVPFKGSTRGSIQPDLLRVLDQDGFAYEIIDIKKESVEKALIGHFNKGHYALTLIKRKQNGNLHWVVLSGLENEKYIVVDSLFPEKYTEGKQFLRKNIIGVILVEPRDSSKAEGKGKSHRKGLWEGFRSLFR